VDVKQRVNKPINSFYRFSFQWNKPFTTGLGGMVVTNNDELAGMIEKICSEQMVQPNFKEKTRNI